MKPSMVFACVVGNIIDLNSLHSFNMLFDIRASHVPANYHYRSILGVVCVEPCLPPNASTVCAQNNAA